MILYIAFGIMFLIITILIINTAIIYSKFDIANRFLELTGSFYKITLSYYYKYEKLDNIEEKTKLITELLDFLKECTKENDKLIKHFKD